MQRRVAALLLLFVAMTAACRLLTVAGGAGTFSPRYSPPPGDSWTRYGAPTALLSPDVAWEQTAVYEPTVVRESATSWKMWYSGGWDDPAMGYATSTDGTTWSKYAGNPVLGQGGSGVSGMAVRNSVFKVSDTYHCFYADANPDANLKHATSTDGISWTVVGTAIAKDAVAWSNGWANSQVWIEGSTWHMMVDGYQASTTHTWVAAYATSSDGTTWTLQHGGPLTTLQVAANGMYASPYVVKVGAIYHGWYHAAPGSGVLPTNMYHATSTDLETWTRTTPAPVLTHLGSGFEVDQVADPSLVTVNTTSYLYYDGDNNAAEAAHILLATAASVVN